MRLGIYSFQNTDLKYRGFNPLKMPINFTPGDLLQRKGQNTARLRIYIIESAETRYDWVYFSLKTQ